MGSRKASVLPLPRGGGSGGCSGGGGAGRERGGRRGDGGRGGEREWARREKAKERGARKRVRECDHPHTHSPPGVGVQNNITALEQLGHRRLLNLCRPRELQRLHPRQQRLLRQAQILKGGACRDYLSKKISNVSSLVDLVYKATLD
jgi:hypothetical protein